MKTPTEIALSSLVLDPLLLCLAEPAPAQTECLLTDTTRTSSRVTSPAPTVCNFCRFEDALEASEHPPGGRAENLNYVHRP